MKLTLEQAEQMMKENDGNLDLYERKDITKLPDNLTVHGYLDLNGTNITSLPDNFTVYGYLDLHGTKITRIPAGVIVNGDIILK